MLTISIRHFILWACQKVDNNDPRNIIVLLCCDMFDDLVAEIEKSEVIEVQKPTKCDPRFRFDGATVIRCPSDEPVSIGFISRKQKIFTFGAK